jgi:putative nucleotidyltransferase with HDIG domain
MADLDGIGLLERTKEKFPDMPVVMVTAVHDISVALAAIRNGAYDYLLKPFEREQLLNAVGRALENRRLKVENRTYQTNLESLVEARTDQLQLAMSDLEKSYDITLQALGDALDLKDAETEGHSRRVTAFTIAIARAMGVPREQILIIARGAFLHDIGKMAIPDNILRKPGKLDDDERAIMREHCYHGYQMLKKIPFLTEACDIVYSHQEHFDGSGYPRGLKGTEIPLGARIFSVADTLDAIISDRPYRPFFSRCPTTSSKTSAAKSTPKPTPSATPPAPKATKDFLFLNCFGLHNVVILSEAKDPLPARRASTFARCFHRYCISCLANR